MLGKLPRMFEKLQRQLTVHGFRAQQSHVAVRGELCLPALFQRGFGEGGVTFAQ